MRARIILAASAMALSAVGLAGASTATANEDAPSQACAATGDITLNTGLSLVPNYKYNVGGSGTFNCGPLVGNVAVTVNLTKASCGDSEGTATINGRPATVTTKASLIVVIGSDIVITGNAVADPTIANNSCVNGTARVFQVTAAGVL